MDLRVVSYNIRHGTDADDTPSLDQIADVLAFLDADIVALQEVDMNLPRSQNQKQAARLAKYLNMGYVFGEAMRYKTGSYGNAVLSRFPIRKYNVHPLPDPKENRCCLEVHIEVAAQILGFFAVHLGLNHLLRIEHVQQKLLPALNSFSGPAILAGDFNAAANQQEITLITQQLTDSFAFNTGILVDTFPAVQPVERIDYIFVNTLVAVKQFYITDTLASDHLPITAELLI